MATRRPYPGWLSDRRVWGIALFMLIAVVGLSYVKWFPYYHKAFLAASHHSIGVSIITGEGASAPQPGWQAAWGYAVAYGKSIWQAMVLGLVLGSAVEVLLPRAWLMRLLSRSAFRSTVIAGLAAVPSMMCTCCAAPVAVGLARSRVSVGATLAYWLGNPILNPATMVFMGFVLGWEWSALRLIMGMILVFVVAHFAGYLVPKMTPVATAVPVEECVPDESADRRPFLLRWFAAFWKLSIGLLPEYAIILLALGAVRAWLFPAITPELGHGLWLMVGLAVAGTLFVIPTAGEIPIVQTLMSFGLGAGAAGALLTTLPAVSLPSLVMVGRALPVRVMIFVAGCVVLLGLLSGMAALALHLPVPGAIH